MSSEVTTAQRLIGPNRNLRREATRLTELLHGELGRVAELGVWLTGVRGSLPPEPFRRPRAVLVAAPDIPPGDSEDASRSDLLLDALAGGVGVSRRRVDVATDGPTGRSGPACEVPELSEDAFEAAYELGRFVADEEADGGTDLLLAGVHRGTHEVDLAGAVAVSAALLGREPVAMVGTDSGLGSATGLDDRGWMRRVGAPPGALRRARRQPDAGPAAIGRPGGGARIAVLTGLLHQSSVRRTPVLLDGTVVCAAALAVARLAPGAQAWWQAAVRSPDPAADAALAELGLVPLHDFGVRSGDGSGALLALPLLHAAIDLLGALSVDADGR